MHRLQTVIQRKHLVSAPPEASVYDVAVTMTEGRVGALPILAGEDLVGIFSERDLMTRVVVPGLDPRQTRVSDVMTRTLVTASPEETVDVCLEKMQRAGCRHLPVLAEGKLVSLLSMRDLLRDEIEEQETELQSLKAYLHQMPG